MCYLAMLVVMLDGHGLGWADQCCRAHRVGQEELEGGKTVDVKAVCRLFCERTILSTAFYANENTCFIGINKRTPPLHHLEYCFLCKQKYSLYWY